MRKWVLGIVICIVTVLIIRGVLFFFASQQVQTKSEEKKILYDEWGLPLKDGKKSELSVCYDNAKRLYPDGIENYEKEKDRCVTLYR